jgi:hypothetical protein
VLLPGVRFDSTLPLLLDKIDVTLKKKSSTGLHQEAKPTVEGIFSAIIFAIPAK